MPDFAHALQGWEVTTVREHVVLAMTLILAACNAGTEGLAPRALGGDARGDIVIHSATGTFADVRVGMTEADLLSLGHPSTRRSVTMEGDEYPVIDVAIREGVIAECLLDAGRVDRCSTRSPGLRDEHGLGVGSRLSELTRAYPQGKLLTGDEEGRYANFVTGSRVVFELNRKDIDLRCFDPGASPCDVDPGTAVIRAVVHAGPAG